MRIGIDLLWVRPGICGGTESYTRNLLDGFAKYCRQHEFVLYVTRDNSNSFEKYSLCMRMRVCPVDCAVQWRRILWENLFLSDCAKKDRVDIMFIPVYSMPYIFGSRIPYVTVIHDLQALHYPQYFSAFRRIFLKNKWKYACRASAQVITDSDFCKNDILKQYPFVNNKIKTIYAPVTLSQEEISFDEISAKYGIRPGEYFYCVSSLLPHKNLVTILKVVSRLKSEEKSVRLVLSGVGGGDGEFAEELKKLEIEDIVVLTGYVSDEERDCLYGNCEVFLFPSVFEGFGMPPVEAMKKGRPVVTTRESSLEEVTAGRAVYVNHPMDVNEWICKIDEAKVQKTCQTEFPQYETEIVVKQFMEVFENVAGI